LGRDDIEEKRWLMPNEPNPPASADDSLSAEQFKSAVDALLKLRDEGKVLLFFNRRTRLRLIGEPDIFYHAFAPGLTGGEARKKTEEIIEEIKDTVNAVINYDSIDGAVRYEERSRYDKPSSKMGEVSEQEREAFRTLQRHKLEMVSKTIVSESVRERIVRMRTSTCACLDDVDYELIRERKDSRLEKEVTSAFLRLRVRYSDLRLHQAFGIFFAGPFPELEAPPSSFELECDLSDLDLLIKRLGEAKQHLLKSESPESRGE
jgi:hypothetical protein